MNSAKEFQKVTGVSDSLLTVIQPLFKFPEWTKNSQKTAVKPKAKPNAVKDLNTVTETQLQKIRGIGKVLAKRIVKYRTSLGGFRHNHQLYKVYYLDTIVANRVLEKYQVLNSP